MIAHQSDQQLWCQSKIFQVRTGQLRRQRTQHSGQSAPSIVKTRCPGWFLQRHGQASVHPRVSTLSQGTSGLAAALEQCLHTHVHWRTARWTEQADTGTPCLYAVYTFPVGCGQDTAGSSACAFWWSIFRSSSIQQDTASVLLHLGGAFKSLYVQASGVSEGRRHSTSQRVQPGARSRSVAHNWIQQRAPLLGTLLLQACEPKGREFGCAPAF